MRVSRNKLEKVLEEEALGYLFLEIKKVHTVKDVLVFLDRNVTVDEKHVILRRGAVMRMLVYGKTYREIKDTLEVSRNTISNVRDMMLGRGYGRNPKRHRVYEKVFMQAEEKRKPVLKRKYKGASSIF